jgi:hypothetical protein
MFAKKSERALPNAADLAEDITRFLNGEPVRAETLTPTIESKKTEIISSADKKVFFRDAKYKFGTRRF